MALVVGREQRFVRVAGGLPPLRFHGGTALKRLRTLRRGGGDYFLRAAGIRPGDAVLDCTAGQLADALVAAWAVGPRGRVLALESSVPMYALLEFGVQHLLRDEPLAAEALERVEVRLADHREVLAGLPAGSFDVVAFDPMFRTPGRCSPGFATVRAIADYRPLEAAVLREAVRVARRRVVVKDHPSGEELVRLGLARWPDPRRRPPVAFGIVDVARE